MTTDHQTPRAAATPPRAASTTPAPQPPHASAQSRDVARRFANLHAERVPGVGTRWSWRWVR